MEKNLEETPPGCSRKRQRQPETWQRNVKKKLLYSPKEMPDMPKCNHRGAINCKLLRMADIKKFHSEFYKIPTKQHQDTFFCKYVKKVHPLRERKRENEIQTLSMQFYVENHVGNMLRVCRQTFLDILRVSKHRILGVFKNFKKDEGTLVPTETRGGWRKENRYASKRSSVIAFIKTLKGVESHYGRGKTNRIYLPSELNVKKLWRMYNNSLNENNLDLTVKLSYFRFIFNTKFNASFSTPATDECSTCIEFESKLKTETNDENIKNLKLAKQLHRKKAKCFFEYLRTKPKDCLLLSYDCQKNLVLPKVSDQSAYYSRQLYCYNLTVVTGPSVGKLAPENVSIYTWAESEGKKSSNEVASVVFHELTSKDLAGYTNVRLVADGCAGQNKNINVLTMCAAWLCNVAPPNIKYVELVFPVTGHSFMPADRVFGLIEKELRKIKTIINLAEYHAIFKKYGTVKEIGKDWEPYDWKEEAKRCVKSASQLHFQMSKCKRIILSKSKKSNKNILVNGELAYNVNTGVSKLIQKRGKTISMVKPSPIPVGGNNLINHLKLRDVANLLQKHFGKDWRELEELQWYKKVLEENTNETDDNIEECECNNPDYVVDEDVYCASGETL